MAKGNDTAATIGFESDLWRAADALRSNTDTAEYKHVVLGLIFLKYISDAFEECYAQLVSEVARGMFRSHKGSTYQQLGLLH